ncbi:MAG TPA: hypothetical protein VEP94_02335 [Solirubrobacterales bacterium]|jgi:hypothetical protein|nr:hypothetical protein [Solirubrobacterales bacterium]
MATHEDATLLVQLAQWGAMINLGEAMGAVFDDEFDAETAESHDPPVQTILAYGETVGTLVKNDVLDQGLVLDWLWVQGMWDRVGPAAVRARDRLGSDALYENFEALASAQAG